MAKRKEDTAEKTVFRSDRFFCEGSQWYFYTREGAMQGPYESRADAEQELMMYLHDLDHRSQFGIKPGG